MLQVHSVRREQSVREQPATEVGNWSRRTGCADALLRVVVARAEAGDPLRAGLRGR